MQGIVVTLKVGAWHILQANTTQATEQPQLSVACAVLANTIWQLLRHLRMHAHYVRQENTPCKLDQVAAVPSPHLLH